jgi:hypothetical protein
MVFMGVGEDDDTVTKVKAILQIILPACNFETDNNRLGNSNEDFLILISNNNNKNNILNNNF